MADAKGLTDRVLNIFVLDRNKRPIPGATVTLFINGEEGPSAITRGTEAAPITLQAPQELQSVTLKAQYTLEGRLLTSEPRTVSLEQRNFEIIFPEVVMPTHIPSWFPIAGYAAGATTLLFFMYVALFQQGPPTFAHVIVMAIGIGLAATFLGGDAAAKGYLPIPFLNSNPLAVSVGGGIGAFLITLVAGATLFLKQPEPVNPDEISMAFGQDVPLQVAIDQLEKAKNITVRFGSSCPAEVGKTMIAAGTHRGDDPQEFLDDLQHRFRNSRLEYSVIVTRGLSYEIRCA